MKLFDSSATYEMIFDSLLDQGNFLDIRRSEGIRFTRERRRRKENSCEYSLR